MLVPIFLVSKSFLMFLLSPFAPPAPPPGYAPRCIAHAERQHFCTGRSLHGPSFRIRSLQYRPSNKFWELHFPCRTWATPRLVGRVGATSNPDSHVGHGKRRPRSGSPGADSYVGHGRPALAAAKSEAGRGRVPMLDMEHCQQAPRRRQRTAPRFHVGHGKPTAIPQDFANPGAYSG